VKALSDEQLFDRYRKGDVACLREIIERYQPDLMRFLYRLVGDQAGAEDVFQETFVQLHLSAAAFDMDRKFRPWLFTIAANKARDFLRKKNRRRMLELSAPMSGGSDDDASSSYVDLLEVDVPPPDARLSNEETSERVQRALDRLPYALREILLLAYFQRLSYAQVADELGIPLGTVKSRLHSAVAAFAKAWEVEKG
jgi:RNA polymerase sigma-70 factor (ECF subfamily)